MAHNGWDCERFQRRWREVRQGPVSLVAQTDARLAESQQETAGERIAGLGGEAGSVERDRGDSATRRANRRAALRRRRSLWDMANLPKNLVARWPGSGRPRGPVRAHGPCRNRHPTATCTEIQIKFWPPPVERRRWRKRGGVAQAITKARKSENAKPVATSASPAHHKKKGGLGVLGQRCSGPTTRRGKVSRPPSQDLRPCRGPQTGRELSQEANDSRLGPGCTASMRRSR